MTRWQAYLTTASKIVDAYDGGVPLAGWLKDYFRQHKQMGATDRKMVADLVYSFYRLGHAARQAPAEQRMLVALFCCNQLPHQLLQHLWPVWNEQVHLPLLKKLAVIHAEMPGIAFNIDDIFPWKNELSEGVDEAAFNNSFLQQPDLFLRLRPGKETAVQKQLTYAGIAFQSISPHCIALPNATKVDGITAVGTDAIVQDYSSQRTGEFFGLDNTNNPVLWDCCAASGGKSIMAYDITPRIQLTVSDIRGSILHNLHQRFIKAGIKHYRSFVADLTKPTADAAALHPDILLADLPCTGSGTWARTPEQLYFFNTAKINDYSNLQKKILSNIIPQLRIGGKLIYITCSVFKKENEEVAAFIEANYRLCLTEMQLLQGYHQKADTMFVAVFEKK